MGKNSPECKNNILKFINCSENGKIIKFCYSYRVGLIIENFTTIWCRNKSISKKTRPNYKKTKININLYLKVTKICGCCH